MTCQERKESLLLYAVGALDSAEMAALRSHLLTGCPECAGALAEAEATVHQLPLGLPQRTAPAGAWDKLEMRIALKEEAEGTRGESEGEHLAGRVSTAGKPTMLAWTGWAAAAAVAVTMGVLLHNANLRTNDALVAAAKNDHAQAMLQQALMSAGEQTTKLTTRVASLEERLKQFDADHGKLQMALDTSKRESAEMLDRLMRGERFAIAPAAMPGVDGALFWDRVKGTWTLLASNVKPAPDGKAYELWVITAKGEKIAAGTFVPDATGHAQTEATLPKDVGPLAMAAVTDEPAAGVAVPTGQIQFATDLSKKQ